ncbi:hypothetical protein KKD72_01990 [Patescibacteria group bacterium]|nr:hypothetical protein [Patescibacteria group bacterium]
MIKCKLCGCYFKFITAKHLKSKHNYTVEKYVKKFGKNGVGHFSVSSNQLDKNDPRYIKWRESLKNRPAPWNKGQNKETHPGLAKISKTFKKKKINNFSNWREKAIKDGLIKTNYPLLAKSGDLAELIGVVLGDGHIGKFPRTEILSISSNLNNQGFIDRYSRLIESLFDKKPVKAKRKNANCVRIYIYQKNISKRLNIPTGARKDKYIGIPKWIYNNEEYLIRYLRGLYEAEGSFSVHLPTCTYKFVFSNRNKSLLDNVNCSLKKLGFNPHSDKIRVQISRKEEVYRCKDLLQFRKY